MRLIVSFLVLLFVTGCSLFPEPEIRTDIVYRDRPVVHPPLPTPTIIRYNEPYIITKETIQQYDDNVVFQCFEYDDGQDLAIDMESAKSYIRELTAVLCSYREELDEPRCEQYNGNADDNNSGVETDEQEVQNQN